jgi:malate/lactate dehydrogenase
MVVEKGSFLDIVLTITNPHNTPTVVVEKGSFLDVVLTITNPHNTPAEIAKQVKN